MNLVQCHFRGRDFFVFVQEAADSGREGIAESGVAFKASVVVAEEDMSQTKHVLFVAKAIFLSITEEAGEEVSN